MTDLIRLLEWDSAFFERRIARILPSALTPAQLADITAWCQQQAIDCVYFLADAENAASNRLVEQNGFYLTDLRLIFEYRQPQAAITPSPALSDIAIRPFEPSDTDALVTIARRSYTDSRFYYDPCFPDRKADALYETWIRNSTDGSGFADEVLIAERNGLLLGYISCKRHGTLGDIGLVGVTESARGAGVGTALVDASLSWFAQNGCDRVQVITQGRNIGAQRLYQRCGFMTADLRLWYHRWFQNCA